MPTFVCRYALVHAEHYDGTRASALAVAEAFPRRVALDAARDNVLLIVQDDKLVELPPDHWAVEPYLGGRIAIMRDDYFHVMHERENLRLP